MQIIRRANELGEEPLNLSNRFCQEYLVDMADLQCLTPTHQPRVSEHMEQIKDMITQVHYLLWFSYYLIKCCEILISLSLSLFLSQTYTHKDLDSSGNCSGYCENILDIGFLGEHNTIGIPS